MDLSRLFPTLVLFKIGLMVMWFIFGFTYASHPTSDSFFFNESEYYEFQNTIGLIDTNTSITNTTNISVLEQNVISYFWKSWDIIKISTLTFSQSFQKTYNLFFGDFQDNETENFVVSTILYLLTIGDIILTFYIVLWLFSRLFSSISLLRR